MRAEERDDVLTLHRAGYTIARIAQTLDRNEATVARIVHEGAADLRARFEAPLLASYERAAAVAAENGDHKPALEMLDRLGSIPETSRSRTALAVAYMTSEAQRAMVTSGANALKGPTVNIGISLPHQMGASSPEVQVLSSEVVRPLAEQGQIVARSTSSRGTHT